MKKAYRRGGVGALMDEYERATAELRRLVETITEDEFERVADAETASEDCRSVQTVMAHVVGGGYGYADYIRGVYSMPSARPPKQLASRRETLAQLDAMLEYTAATLDGKWEMTDEENARAVIHSRWGVTYNLEQLLEHAIVHVLRHRRQVERFLLKLNEDRSPRG